ncbi:MAG: hypothetical protein ACFE7R_09220 [Candidatus Hodarchaeota archaeon]
MRLKWNIGPSIGHLSKGLADSYTDYFLAFVIGLGALHVVLGDSTVLGP